MPKHLAISAVALTVLLGLSPTVRAQTTSVTTRAGNKSAQTWNDAPPDKSAYTGTRKRPAPRRDLSGIWNGGAEGGVQAKGVLEHPALMAGHPADEVGAQPDENNIIHPLPYTPLGLAALQAHKPAVGVRAVGPV